MNGSGKNRKHNPPQHYRGMHDAPDQYPEEQLDFAALQDEAPGPENSAAVNGTKSEIAVQDLPDLPKDLSGLEDLALKHVRPGAIIVFQEIQVSRATGWSPEVSAFKTAMVEFVEEDGLIEVTFALRDIPSENIQFDSKTGERVYSKFDIPAQDDDNDEEDYTSRQVYFGNLLNAKLFIPAPGENDKHSNGSVQCISESYPEAQETSKPADGSLDISLTTVEVPSSHKEELIAHNGNAEVPATASIVVNDSTVGNHSRPGMPTAEFDSEQKQTPGEQLEDTLNEGPTSSLYYSTHSPQFNGFTTPPEQEKSIREDDDDDEAIEANKELAHNHIELEDGDVDSAAAISLNSTQLHFQLIDQDMTDPEGEADKRNEPTLDDPWPASNGHQSPNSMDSSIHASQSQQDLQSPSPPAEFRNPRSRKSGLDGTISSDDDEELPTLEQIVSQVRASQASPSSTKRKPGKQKRRVQSSALDSSPNATVSQRPTLRSRTRASQASVTIDLTQTSDPVPESTSDEEDGDYVTQRSHSGWM